MLRAVVFDFDGVLANTEPLHFRAFRDVLAQERITVTEAEYYERYLGYNDAGAYEAIATDRSLPWDAAKIAALIDRKAVLLEALERGESLLFPGVREAIESLASHCPLAIASGALGAEIRRILEREDLARHFSAIVSSDDPVASKPAPDAYLLAVERLSQAVRLPLVHADCVAIEDSPWGIESARAAGLRTIAVTHTYPAAALAGAEVVVDSLALLTWEFLRTRAALHVSGRP
jgi:beta-phosphoglucomutase